MKDLGQALGIAVCIVEVIVNFLLDETDGRKWSSCNLLSIDWFFKSLSRIWSILSRGDALYDVVLLPSSCLIAILNTARRLSHYFADQDNSQLIIFVPLLTHITANTTTSMPLPLPDGVETALCINFFEIAFATSRLPKSRDCSRDFALPFLMDLLKMETRFDALGMDLQVCNEI